MLYLLTIASIAVSLILWRLRNIEPGQTARFARWTDEGVRPHVS